MNYATLNRSKIAQPASLPSASSAKIDTTKNISSALKVSVSENGLYELTYTTPLPETGLDLNDVDPRTIKLINRSEEIPIVVQREEDGFFDPTDRVLFYGATIRDVYTEENVYWLTTVGSRGQRMDIRNGVAVGVSTATHFPNSIYWLTLPNGIDQDHWFWHDLLSPSTKKMPVSRSYTVNLENI